MSVVKGEKYTGEVKATRSAVKTLLNSLKGCKGRARHQNYCDTLKDCTAGQIFYLFNEVVISLGLSG